MSSFSPAQVLLRGFQITYTIYVATSFWNDVHKLYPEFAKKVDQCCKSIFDSLCLCIWLPTVLVSSFLLGAGLLAHRYVTHFPIPLPLFQKISLLGQTIFCIWPIPTLNPITIPTWEKSTQKNILNFQPESRFLNELQYSTPKQIEADLFLREIYHEEAPIPAQLEKDSVFQKNICPITHHPIRIAVRDSSHRIYEWSALVDLLKRIPASSPDTPLIYEKSESNSIRQITIEELEFCPEIQKAIDDRLLYYSKWLDHFLMALQAKLYSQIPEISQIYLKASLLIQRIFFWVFSRDTWTIEGKTFAVNDPDEQMRLLKNIPSSIEKDPVFHHFCSVMQAPIRFIRLNSKDPQKHEFYEDQVIRDWLELGDTSPYGEPLAREDLVSCEKIQKQIDDRLVFYFSQSATFLTWTQELGSEIF